MRATHLVLGALALASALTACSKESTVEVDRFKELAIVDDEVVLDARSSNAVNGPWSFRHVFESVMPVGSDNGEMLTAWFTEWVTNEQFNGFPLDTESAARARAGRPDQMNFMMMCPWLHATPANECNTDCSKCTGRKLDMAAAPFRLAAIANRIDLRGKPLTLTQAGEARFVFGLTSGPADSPASVPLPLAIIFEFAVPPEIDAKSWAKRWHALGAHPTFDEAYKNELTAITDTFLTRSSSRENGSHISQVRTNESAFFWVWQMREFRLAADGRLHSSTVANTPSLTLNNSDQLEQFIKANADAIRSDTHVVPPALLGGSISVQEPWKLDGVDPALARSFSETTCNGCHATTHTGNFKEPFQVSPMRQGRGKLSKFMNDPENGGNDQLSQRERDLAAVLGN